VGQERTTPRRDRVASATGHDGRWQPADRASALVEQAGLAGQRLTLLADPDDVAAALADAVALDHDHVRLVAVDLGHVGAQPTRRGAGVELGLDDDLAVHDVQAAREPEHRGDFGLAAAGLGDLRVGQFGLHLCRHRHEPILARASTTLRARPDSTHPLVFSRIRS
jgi:hypothetical protein